MRYHFQFFANLSSPPYMTLIINLIKFKLYKLLKPIVLDENVMDISLQTAVDDQSIDIAQDSISVSTSRAQKLIFGVLKDIRYGSISVDILKNSKTFFGSRESNLNVDFQVNHPQLFERIVQGGSIALGESYMDGWWDVGNDRLVDFFKLLFLNKFEYRFLGDLKTKLQIFIHKLISTPMFLSIAKKDVHQHYDLGNDFFKQMLDSSMAYSCGYQCSAEDSLDEMQQNKYARVCKKLGLERGGRLIDIGCGWGGMLLYAGEHYPNVHGIGITLSREQQKLANDRLSKEGLSDRFKVYYCDYRNVKGAFDYVVSIGMFEHIGYLSYRTFFKKVSELLTDNGIALLHTIGLEEDPKIPFDPWTAKYIFPGARLPRLEEIAKELRKAGLFVGHTENLRPHYARTLRLWNESVKSNLPNIQQIGEKFDERFFRMWNYFLQLSEACFTDSTMELYQVLFTRKNRWNFPMRFEF